MSNSLPAWLSLNNYNPFYGYGNTIPLWPSFLSPQNFEPPFATVHVIPEGTRALAMTQHIGRKTSSLSQLCADRVRVTFWGVRNDDALDFVACVNQFTTDRGIIGLMNMPAVRDDKRTQAELTMIGMKKSIDFEVSYHQFRMNDIARQLITKVVPTFYVEGAKL